MLIRSFEFRPVRPDEFQRAGDLVADTYLEEGYADEEYAALLRDVATRSEEAEVLVAVDSESGEIQGTVTYVGHGQPHADIARPSEAELRMLAVARCARGRGVGRALVEACIERAQAEGRRRLVLSTLDTMKTAHRLYERLGFVRVPERDWCPLPDLRLLVYSLELQPQQGRTKQT